MTRDIIVGLTFLSVAACAHLQTLDPQLKSDWNRALYLARTNADSGNYFAADKVLDEFARTHPGTREAQEVAFWKAAYMLDPANQYGSLGGGIAALDGYIASDSTAWYKTEATVLRRTAAVAQGIASQAKAMAPDSTPPAVTDTVVVVSRSRDEQIAALRNQLAKSKDELAKVSAELERIKKRLANPSG